MMESSLAAQVAHLYRKSPSNEGGKEAQPLTGRALWSPIDVPRSILSVPGHRKAMVAKARGRGADVIAWDLEDSVPVSEKLAARLNVMAALTADDMVRVNGGPLLAEDVAAVRHAGWINLPKVTGAGEIEALRRLAPNVRVLAVIESPLAVARAGEICAAADAVAFGRADFSAAVGRESSRLIGAAMGLVAIHALACGKPCYDSPCELIGDLHQMLAEVGRACSYGFTGKICIHPSQIECCQRFAPQLDPELAKLTGSGAHLMKGRMVAEPHYLLAGGDLWR